MQIEVAFARFQEKIRATPRNWSKALQRDAAFMAFVARRALDMGLPSDIPERDRIYAAVTGDSPLCPHDRTKTLKSAEEGWKGCGKAGSCACAREKLSETNRAARLRKAEKNPAPAVATGDERERLMALVASAPPKGFSQTLQRHPDLLAWVVSSIPEGSGRATLAERVFLALHGVEAAICERGNRKVFNTLQKGYRFCAPACACRREAQSGAIRGLAAALPLEERERRVGAARDTFREKYGVDHALQDPAVVARIAATNTERYGAPTPFAAPAIREKARDTLVHRHGVHAPMLVPGVPEKIAATNLQRHGATHTMAIARRAFAAANEGRNPFQVPEIAARAEASMVERHGVTKPLLSPRILERMRDRFEAVHGARNPMLVPEVRERVRATVFARYGQDSPNQAGFSDEAWAVLQDRDAFRALFEGRALREVASFLQIPYDTCRKWCDRHGVELPKSSYEAAICDTLRARGERVVAGDRTLIKPLELDVLLPDRRIAIEFGGLYWHSDQHKLDPRYHVNKTNLVEEKSWRLVTIFEDEWVLRRPVVESRLDHLLGCSERGPAARKLGIRRVSSETARHFLDEHHIQGGAARGFAAYGAFAEGEVNPCAIMTFSKPRPFFGGKVEDDHVELLRYATDGRAFAGIASRLFAAFRRDFDPPAVVSFADRRWSRGGLYRAMGFAEVGPTPPSYAYFHPNQGIARHSRAKFMKHRVAHLVEGGDALTEAQIMHQLGYFRVWDCGSLKFRWSRP